MGMGVVRNRGMRQLVTGGVIIVARRIASVTARGCAACLVQIASSGNGAVRPKGCVHGANEYVPFASIQ